VNIGLVSQVEQVSVTKLSPCTNVAVLGGRPSPPRDRAVTMRGRQSRRARLRLRYHGCVRPMRLAARSPE